MTLFDPKDYAVHRILWARILEWVAFPSPRDLPNPGLLHCRWILYWGKREAEAKGKPKKTGVDNASLLQGICPTQEFNRGLLHFRQILYQSSYQGSSHKYVSLFFQIIFPIRLLQNTVQYSRSLFVTNCIYSSAYTSVSNSPTIPSSYPSLYNHKLVP